MSDVLSSLCEVILFVVAAVWVGKRPTIRKVCAMIALVSAVEIAFLVQAAAAQGLGPYAWYLQALEGALSQMGSALTTDQVTAFRNAAHVMAGCWFAVVVIGASTLVFTALCVRWMVNRIRHKMEWTPFSLVDLSVWWVLPLIASILCYVVSIIPGVPHADVVVMVAANLFLLSGIPLFVQGAAAGKGVMNRRGLSLTWQLVLGFFGVVTSAIFIILPIMGLFDFWANFRRIRRDGGDPDQPRLEE